MIDERVILTCAQFTTIQLWRRVNRAKLGLIILEMHSQLHTLSPCVAKS